MGCCGNRRNVTPAGVEYEIKYKDGGVERVATASMARGKLATSGRGGTYRQVPKVSTAK